jgi:UDP-glucose:(heptosyl)LPS alpha-1,3-glucosyltransferase
LQIEESATLFLFVGSGFARKGLAEFLQALALTRKAHPDSDMLGLVVGRGDISFYQALARDLGIGERLTFAGGAADTHPYYCAADVFVLPTRFDPFANTTNEALACGLPVITTRTNGAAEIVSPEEGFVVEQSSDVQEMAEAMGALLNQERRQEMSANARRKALQHPWKENVRKTLEVYEEILMERQGKHD